MTAMSLPARRTFDPRTSRSVLLVLIVCAAGILFAIFRDTMTLPSDLDWPVFKALNGVRDTIRDDRPPLIDAIGQLRFPARS